MPFKLLWNSSQLALNSMVLATGARHTRVSWKPFSEDLTRYRCSTWLSCTSFKKTCPTQTLFFFTKYLVINHWYGTTESSSWRGQILCRKKTCCGLKGLPEGDVNFSERRSFCKWFADKVIFPSFPYSNLHIW